ncbi:bifunctional epoxide hydrolase 2 isoform X2 [Prionailurus iriomotensis]
MALRAALFDLYGVLALPSLAGAFGRAEEELALPRGFLNEAFQKGGPDGPSARLMRGEITYSQWVPLMEENCRKCSQDSGIRLPENFSVSQIFGKAAATKINHPMLQAALALRKQGYTTCLLTNNWLDDSAQRGILAQLVCQLRPHFDFLIESCRIRMAKPDPRIYKFVLDTLNASPNEVVFLDDIGANLEPARDLGMVTILVHDTDTALRELEKVTGVQASPSCHRSANRMQSEGCEPRLCANKGLGCVCILWSWAPVLPCACAMDFRRAGSLGGTSIPALAQAGFRVLALDMKGYGESSAPPEIEEYSLEVLCKEMVTFLDKLGITQAVFIGHDWGGMLVWNMALFYPERVSSNGITLCRKYLPDFKDLIAKKEKWAVASLNTPFIPADPSVPTMEKIKANPIFDYQLYFQEPGVAEAELEQNLSRTFKSFFRASDERGLFVRTPEEPSLSHIVTEEDIQFYVQQFKKSGFRGPLNWYRNVDVNWKWGCTGLGRKILIPALMVTAEKDVVLTPEMSKHMEDWIPYLKRGHIMDCGHWTQMEKPTELNRILIEWLETDARDPPVVSKL